LVKKGWVLVRRRGFYIIRFMENLENTSFNPEEMSPEEELRMAQDMLEAAEQANFPEGNEEELRNRVEHLKQQVGGGEVAA